MLGPEPRPIARHRAPRRRLSAVARPYPVVVAGLVTLVSAPVLAAVLVGSASITPTSGPRSPFVADPSQDPVVVPGRGTAATSPTTAPTGLPSPTPTPTPVGEGLASATADGTAGGTGTKPRQASNAGGSRSHCSSGSRPGPAPRRPSPAPQSSTGQTGGGSPRGSGPTVPPVTASSVPGVLPGTPVVPLSPPPPLPLPGVAGGLDGVVGTLLGVLA